MVKVTKGLGVLFTEAGNAGTGLFDIVVVPNQGFLVPEQHGHGHFGSNVLLAEAVQFQVLIPG